MNTPPLPPNHEPLPADFLRKFGAVKGMKFCQNHSGAEWKSVNYKVGAMLPSGWEKHFWCAPIGTCAAASTPLPVLDCDCGCDGEECFSNCASNRRYHHILPHELAAMENKPEGLIYSYKDTNDWHPVSDFVWQGIKNPPVDNLGDFAYAVPVRAEEGKPSGCSQLTQLQETITLRDFTIAQLTRERDGLRTSLANAREHLQMVAAERDELLKDVERTQRAGNNLYLAIVHRLTGKAEDRALEWDVLPGTIAGIAAERDSLARQLDLANEPRPLSTQTRKEGGVEKPTAEAADANANVLGSCSGASPDSSPPGQPQSKTGTPSDTPIIVESDGATSYFE